MRILCVSSSSVEYDRIRQDTLRIHTLDSYSVFTSSHLTGIHCDTSDTIRYFSEYARIREDTHNRSIHTRYACDTSWIHMDTTRIPIRTHDASTLLLLLASSSPLGHLGGRRRRCRDVYSSGSSGYARVRYLLSTYPLSERV